MRFHASSFAAAPVLPSLAALARILFVSALLALLTNAHAQPVPRDANAAAAAISNAGKGFSPVYNADGSMQRDAAGQPVMKPGSALDPRTGLQYFENLTGVKGAELSGIATRTGVGAARVKQTLSTDISCQLDAGKQRSVGGVSILIGACQLGLTGQVEAMTMQFCDARLTGAYCSADKYSQPVSLPVDQFSAVSFGSAGLGCSTTGAFCRLTLNIEQALTGNAAALRQQTEARALTQTQGNSLRGSVTQTVTDPTYADKLIGYGTSLKECVDKNAVTMGKDGAVSTCNGYWNTRIGAASGQQCETRQYCAKPVTTQLQYERSCTRTLPLTGASCVSEIPTLSCEVSLDGTGAQTQSTCTADQLDGGLLVSSTEAVCEPGASLPQGGCLSSKRTDNYYFPSKAIAKDCSYSPGPAASAGLGSCDQNTSEIELSCASDGWFGRTLDAAQCTNNPEGLDFQGLIDVDYVAKPGCGVCVKPVRGYTCYAQPSATDPEDSCAAAELQGCSLKASVVQSTTTGGLVTSQEEVYACTKATESCEQWATEKVDPGCLGAAVAGTVTPDSFARPDNSKAMGEALAAAAIMNAVSQSESDDPTIPRIFQGGSSTCKKPTGGFGSLVYQDCCKISLERPKSKFGKLNECKMEEAELAAARRAHYTKYIGDRCSKRTAFPRKCIQRTQHYCAFDGILPRLIHEQGRAQLAEIVRSSGGAQREDANVEFAFYRTQNEPGWTAPTTVNGVRVAFWQHPAYCSELKKANAHLLENPDAYECPGKLTQWVATCDSANCGELPTLPEHGAEGWLVSAADPLEKVTTAIGKGAVMNGACDPAQGGCAYQLSAWPAGQLGQAVVSKEVTFPLYQADANSVSGSMLTNAGDLVINPRPLAGSTSAGLPAEIAIRISQDGGTSWVGYALPSRIANEITLRGTDISVVGGCEISANVCQYRFTTTVSVSAKPWGSPGREDCSGFTAGQISVLDFGKMDLSEWLATVIDKVQAGTQANLAAIAASQFTAYNDVMNGNASAQREAYASPDSARPAQAAAAPSGATFATVTPSEGFGPFVAEIRTAGVWPFVSDDPAENKDTVLSVSVDWGDCSGEQPLSPASSIFGPQAQGFIGQHAYPAPDELGCKAASANVLIPVTLKVTTALSGTKTVVLQVQNAWSTMPGAASSGLEQNRAVTGSSKAR